MYDDLSNNRSGVTTTLYGLDAIRCLAALSIMLTHISNNAHKIGLHPQNFLSTTIGVNVFFVLSGFLITYLILNESYFSMPQLKNFYIRRILRIWPLYYFYLILTLTCSIILAPQLINVNMIMYYVFLLPNVPWIFDNGLPFLHHYWSLGVEEQFYIVWPIVIIVSGRRLLYFTSILCLSFITINVLCIQYWPTKIANSMVYACQYHTLLIGCIGAVLLKRLPNVIQNIASQKWLAVIAWLTLMAYQLDLIQLKYFNEMPAALATLVILFNLIVQKPWPLLFDNKVMKYIGRISFGIYIYHPLVIGTLIFILRKCQFNIGSMLYYVLVIVITILVASLSYEYFENKFLKLKTKFY